MGKRYTDKFKAKLLAEATAPGESVASVARRHGIHPDSLYAWSRKQRSEKAEASAKAPRRDFGWDASEASKEVQAIADGVTQQINASPAAQKGQWHVKMDVGDVYTARLLPSDQEAIHAMARDLDKARERIRHLERLLGKYVADAAEI